MKEVRFSKETEAKDEELSPEKAEMISAAGRVQHQIHLWSMTFMTCWKSSCKNTNSSLIKYGTATKPGSQQTLRDIVSSVAKGESAYEITCGTGKENITTLTLCSAAGDVLEPVVIFPGKNFKSTWKGVKALPETCYGLSDNGWMTSDVFDWFQLLVKRVTKRPLLIFDGHLSHTSLSVIELAIEEQIVILKLPPHATDKLQPLNVACFSALKYKWSSVVITWNREWGASKPINKHVFVNKISEVWHKGLTSDKSKQVSMLPEYVLSIVRRFPRTVWIHAY